MAWIESNQEVGRHPKTKKLARLLGISAVTAVGHLHFLWWWALDFAKDGDLSKYDSVDIADAMMWNGDAPFLVQALFEAGFLDKDDTCLSIHDWNNGRWSRKQRNEMRRQWEAMSRRIRPYLLERDNYQCQECGDTEGPLEIDHIIPIAQGGINDLDNLQVLCLPCNRKKGAS